MKLRQFDFTGFLLFLALLSCPMGGAVAAELGAAENPAEATPEKEASPKSLHGMTDLVGRAQSGTEDVFGPRPYELSEARFSPFKREKANDEQETTIATPDESTRYRPGPYFRPLFNGLHTGTGFGLGVMAFSGDRISSRFGVYGGTHYTTGRAWESIAGIMFAPTPGGPGQLNVKANGRYLLEPREVFFGHGIDPIPDTKTTYELRETGVGVTGTFMEKKKYRFGASVDYSKNEIRDGHLPDYPSTLDYYGTGALPELSDAVNLLGVFGFTEYITRDSAGDPRSGFVVRAHAGPNYAVGNDSPNLDYFNFLADARGYIPVPNKKSVVALRWYANLNHAGDGHAVPLFRLARIGGSKILRGEDTFRYQGNMALAGSIEYRLQFVRYVDAVVFGDFGEAVDHFDQFSLGDFETTWGGGVVAKTKHTALAHVLVAKGSDKTRVLFGMGKTF